MEPKGGNKWSDGLWSNPNSHYNGQFGQPSLAELNESMRSKEGSSTILKRGVGASAPKYSLSGNGEDDIASAVGKAHRCPG